ncbi:MAG: molybdopterin-dependent oxidoreductase [Nitrososphaerales archaeon]
MLKDEAVVRTNCDMCWNNCGLLVRKVNGIVVNIEGDPENPHSKGMICAKGLAAPMNLYSPHRVKTPMKRTNPEKGIGIDPKWQEIEWEEALSKISEVLTRIRKEDPRQLVLQTFDGGSRHLWETFASAFGSPNVMAGGGVAICGNNRHGVVSMVHGSFRSRADLDYCNYYLLVGTQIGGAVETKVGVAEELANARKRGLKLVVVDPRCSNIASKADEWIPIRPGTYGMLALSMLNVLLNELRIFDAEFLRNHTNAPYLIGADGHYQRDQATNKPLIWDSLEGIHKPFDSPIDSPSIEGEFEIDGQKCKPAFQLLKDHVKTCTPEYASQITSVPSEIIRRLATEWGQNAKIGSRINIDGTELPHRPVALGLHKGTNAQLNSQSTAIAFYLLLEVVGAIDVPGGVGGVSPTITPQGGPSESPDGLLVPAPGRTNPIYPGREAVKPDTLNLRGLFPLGGFIGVLNPLTMQEPEKFGIPYKVEALIQTRTNYVMTTPDPHTAAESLKRIPFMVSITNEINETAEFADLILPDFNFLEWMVFSPTERDMSPGRGSFYYSLSQPVVEPQFKKPPFKANHSIDFLVEIAHRVGFLDEFNSMVNVSFHLKDPYLLQPSKRYDIEEISDLRAKSRFGPEHDLNWFKEHGFIEIPKKIEQAYPRPFLKPRIPIYFEHFLSAGKQVKSVSKEMGLDWWDTTNYQALPHWRPGPALSVEDLEYDLFAIDFKVPIHTLTFSANNAWLVEVAESSRTYDIWINKITAQKKGIPDSGLIEIESKEGMKVRGRAKLTECIHPEVLAIPSPFGQWAKDRPLAKGKGTCFSELVPLSPSRIDFVDAAFDVQPKVKIRMVE